MTCPKNVKICRFGRTVLGTDDISKQQCKNHVKKAVRSSFEEEAKIKIKQLKKLSEGPLVDEDFECRPYLKELTLSEARTNFRFRSKMTDLAWNYKHDKSYEADLWKCERSQSCIETQEHVLVCPAYADLREGKDIQSDKDLVSYMQGVMLIRDKLRITK